MVECDSIFFKLAGKTGQYLDNALKIDDWVAFKNNGTDWGIWKERQG